MPIKKTKKVAPKKHAESILRTIYLYLFSGITLVIILISGISLVDLGIKELLNIESLPHRYACDSLLVSDKNEGTIPVIKEGQTGETFEQCMVREANEQAIEDRNRKKRDIASAMAGLLVALPLFIYHWKLILKKVKV